MERCFSQRQLVVILRSVAGLLLGLSMFACSSVHVRQTGVVARRPVQALAIVPFDNLTAEPQAALAISGALVDELRRRGQLKIVEGSSVLESLDRSILARVATELGVDAVLVGTVTEYV